MKIVILSMGYSGYWVACWRELMKRQGVELKVFSPETKYPYSSDFLDGLPISVFSKSEMDDSGFVCKQVVDESPDVIIIGGWASSSFKSVAFDSRLKNVKKILMIDSAWIGSLKQIAQRFLLRRFLNRMNGIIVAGERGRQYARWLGFRSEQIFTSIYGYDAEAFSMCYDRRKADHKSWPRRFCFVGRYAEIKGLSSLLEAYKFYRSQVGLDAWPLDCYGKGPMKDVLLKQEGVIDHGFLQPNDLPSSLVNEGVFVFPSIHEPWGVALAEAAGAGLPIICSDQVASGLDLVKNEFNGIVFPAGNVKRLTSALLRMHHRVDELPTLGLRSRVLSEAFSPKVWCDRWMEVFKCI